jgi:hypothetical protein
MTQKARCGTKASNRKRARNSLRNKRNESSNRTFADKIQNAWADACWEQELSHMLRPRVHLSLFDEPNPKSDHDQDKVRQLVKTLGSTDRFEEFAQLASAFTKMRDLKTYLLLRRKFPEVDIQVARFGGLDPVIAIKSILDRLGIDVGLVLGATGDAFGSDMDELSLQLIQHLVDKDEKRKARKLNQKNSHSRDLGIPDYLVDYLLLSMLDGMEWRKLDSTFPGSLLVLLHERLGGGNPQLHKEWVTHEKRQRAACIAAQTWPSGKIPVRKFAKVTGTSKSTADRWLSETDTEFQQMLERWRRTCASDAFQQAIIEHRRRTAD